MYDQVRFIPGIQSRFNTQKSINVTHHVKRLKTKYQLLISKHVEKFLRKFIIHSFMIKISSKLVI